MTTTSSIQRYAQSYLLSLILLIILLSQWLSIEHVLPACILPPTVAPVHGSAMQEMSEDDESDDACSTTAEDPEVCTLTGTSGSEFSYPLTRYESYAALDEANIPLHAK